jgi:hypothetical protein
MDGEMMISPCIHAQNIVYLYLQTQRDRVTVARQAHNLKALVQIQVPQQALAYNT